MEIDSTFLIGKTQTDLVNLLYDNNDDIQYGKEYRMFLKLVINPIWENLIKYKNHFCIYINQECFSNLEFPEIKTTLTKDKLNEVFMSYNYVEIDGSGNIIENSYISKETKETKSYLRKLSLTNHVFYFGPDGVDRYLNGIPVEENNFFYSIQDEKNYYKKKDISEFEEVINEYTKQHVTQSYVYMTFFASKAEMHGIDVSLKKNNILKNKPEHYMRDDLYNYLKEHMKYSFSIEPELGQTKRELDIYFDVDGIFQFIEVKWIGKCINGEGTAISGTVYGAPRVKEGIIQSLEYIEELNNTSQINSVRGYLAVFDARDNKEKIEIPSSDSFLSPTLQEYLCNFKILQYIELQKTHSA